MTLPNKMKIELELIKLKDRNVCDNFMQHQLEAYDCYEVYAPILSRFRNLILCEFCLIKLGAIK